jgi:hypothetical protein
MVATCNVGKYDVPEEVYNSPTIRLYPVYDKKCPMQYFGDLENKAELSAFIDESATSERYFTPAPRNWWEGYREM